MKIKSLQINRALSAALFVLLVMAGMTKVMAQQPNQTKLTEYNFHNLGTIEERVFLLHAIQESEFYSYALSDEEGKIDIFVSDTYQCQDSNPNSDYDFFLENVYDEWNAYSNLDKTERGSLFVEWRYQLEDEVFLAINEDFNRQLRDGNATCGGALPFCTDIGLYEYPAGVNSGNLGSSMPPYFCSGFVRPTGYSTGCLSTTPNPAFYYMQIDQPGNLNIYMYTTPSRDIDFDCWGPFDDIETACSQLSCSNMVDCSYSANQTENCHISNAQSGQYYILLITNYSNQPANISFENIGTGSTVNFQGEQSTITAFASPAEGGTISGGGVYDFGSTCTLTATPNQGYSFMYWTENGAVISYDAEYSFAVTFNRNFVANFTLPLTITASSDPEEGGSVSGTGEYDYGSTCTLTATANEGYSFYYWTKNGSIVSYDETYSFVVTENMEFVANFGSPLTLNITAIANPLEGGTVTGSGEYDYYSTCTLTATANEGYSFYYWTKNGSIVSYDETYSFVVTENMEFVANFGSPLIITAIANPLEGGTVTGSGEYDYYSTCTLTVTANQGYTFMYWTENGQQVSSNTTYSFTVTADRNLVANFALPFSVTATAIPEEGGSVTGSGEYDYNSTCTLTATANEGYTFMYWTENGQQVSSDATYPFTVTGDRNLFANFALPFSISATANPEEGGSVTGAGEYDYGSICTLTATANEGYVFRYWTSEGSIVSFAKSYSFTVTGNLELVANFVPLYTITVTANPDVGGSVWMNGFIYRNTILTHGEEYETPFSWTEPVAVNATADYDPNASASTNTGNRAPWDLMATFNAAEAAQYGVATDGQNIYTCNWGYSSATWNFYKYDMQGNMIEGFNVAGCGTIRDLTYDGQYFYGGANSSVLYCIDLANHNLISSTSTTCSGIRHCSYDPVNDGFWVGGWSDLRLIDRTGATITNGPAVESVSGSGYYEDEDGNPHLYLFTQAASDAKVYDYNILTNTVGAMLKDFSTTPGYDAGSSGGAFIGEYNGKIAFFGDVQQSPNLIGIYELRDGGGVGPNPYYQGQTCTLKALPNGGYKFNNWTEEDEIVSTDAVYSFVVESDRSLVANFEALTNHWTAESYPNSMFMIGVVQIDGVEQASPTLELGAFCNGECRGAEFPIYEEGRWLYFMAIGGNSGDDITFRLYDHGLQQELNLYCYNVLPFVDDGFVGLDDFYEVLFVSSTFTISADVNPIGAGTITGLGEYWPGTSVTLTATANEGYAFNSWTSDGEIVSTEPSYTFTVNGSVHLTANFDFVQMQQLTLGWNWFSTYLEITLDDLKAALLAAFPNVGANALVIKSKSGQTSWNPLAQRWVGSLNTIDLSQMYMIKVPTDIVITLQGVPINLADHPVTIKNGVNWIAFPSSESMSVTNAFAGFAVNGDMVKSKANGVAAYYGTIWAGALKNLVPGQGYIYKSNVQYDRTFTLPISTR